MTAYTDNLFFNISAKRFERLLKQYGLTPSSLFQGNAGESAPSTPKKKAPATPKKRAAKDEDDDEHDEGDTPAPSPKKAKAPIPGKQGAKAVNTKKEEPEDEGVDMKDEEMTKEEIDGEA
jgi:hypothetical protein